MSDLSGAVAKTMTSVFAGIEKTNGDIKKRIAALKANLGKVATIALDEIETSENVRKSIDTESESFSRLVESIKKYGVLENVVVELRVNKKGTNYKLVCVAGHRRILAAKAAKSISRVPCLLQSFSHKGDSVGAALAENLNREDLHCLDVAEGYEKLKHSGWGEEDLAQHFCRDIRTIRHYVKMAQWSDEVKSLLRENSKKFSTRIIMREFAYRKFDSEQALIGAIKASLEPGIKKKQSASKANIIEAKTINPHDKKVLKAALKDYLAQQKLISGVIKDEIKKAFEALNLI